MQHPQQQPSDAKVSSGHRRRPRQKKSRKAKTAASPLLRHLRQTYPAVEWHDHDFTFQEHLRTLDAKAYDSDQRERVINGQHALEQLCQLILGPQAETLTSAFRTLIQKELDQALPVLDQKSNVRGLIKRIWTYPLTSYLPWRKVDESAAIVEAVQHELELQTPPPPLAMEEGKVYLMLDPFFVKRVWERCGGSLSQLFRGFSLSPQQQEACHLTLVNSDVVSKLNTEQVSAMVGGAITDLKCTGISHTVSLDWPLFSICVVANLESRALQEFVRKFNEAFHLTLKPSFHVTLAVLPRRPPSAGGE